MINKIIFMALTFTTIAYASIDKTTNIESANKDQTVYKSLPLEITKDASGKSCDNGNCVDGSKCFTKDGPLPKCVSKVAKNVKRFCKKL